MYDRQAISFALLVSVPWLFGGCAASEAVQVDYDASLDQSTYESTRVLMGSVGMAMGLASNQRIMWKAVASCTGYGCTPREVELILYNDSDRELNVDTRRLQISFDGTSRDWEDLSRIDEPAHFVVAHGEFFRVSLSGAEFVRMAKAEQVEVLLGQSGTQSIDITYGRRAAFRTFAQEVGLDE